MDHISQADCVTVCKRSVARLVEIDCRDEKKTPEKQLHKPWVFVVHKQWPSQDYILKVPFLRSANQKHFRSTKTIYHKMCLFSFAKYFAVQFKAGIFVFKLKRFTSLNSRHQIRQTPKHFWFFAAQKKMFNLSKGNEFAVFFSMELFAHSWRLKWQHVNHCLASNNSFALNHFGFFFVFIIRDAMEVNKLKRLYHFGITFILKITSARVQEFFCMIIFCAVVFFFSSQLQY